MCWGVALACSRRYCSSARACASAASSACQDCRSRFVACLVWPVHCLPSQNRTVVGKSGFAGAGSRYHPAGRGPAWVSCPVWPVPSVWSPMSGRVGRTGRPRPVNAERAGSPFLGQTDPRVEAGTDVDGEIMTASVVLSTLTIGVDQLVASKTMFCNAERGVLLGETPVTLPPHRTVIEVLESVAVDDETVDGRRALRAAGYSIALDDFVWFDDVERLIAEKCETEDDVQWAAEAGFELFQGYAIQRPEIVRGTTIAPSALTQVQLAMTLLTEQLDFEEIEEILCREPGLVLQVLQLASIGSHRGMRRQVQTVHEALVLLGTIRIRQWVALTILGGQQGGRTDALATALVRAGMAELAAPLEGLEPGVAFTAGLLSALDLLLGVDLEEIESSLDLDRELVAAAFHREGRYGDLVARVAAYQDAIDAGTDPGERLAALDASAPRAFRWAMPYVNSLEPPTRADLSADRGRRVLLVTRDLSLHQGLEGPGGHRPAQVPALHEVAAELAQDEQRALVLDPLGHHPQTERVGQVDGGPHDRGGAQLGDDVLAEGAVELDLVDRQREEVLEAAVAGAVVVDREPDTEVVEGLHHDHGRLRVAHHRGLGDLDGQGLGRHLVREQRRGNELDQALV